jgi:hypothetical protein
VRKFVLKACQITFKNSKSIQIKNLDAEPFDGSDFSLKHIISYQGFQVAIVGDSFFV